MSRLFTCCFHLRLALLGVGAFSAACQPNKEADQQAATPATPVTLTFYSWDDYCAPEVLDRFEQETGVKVDLQIFSDAEQVEARLRSDPGTVDVIVVDSFNLAKLIKLRLLQALDKEKLPNFCNMDPQFLDLSSDPGNEYSVPYQWGTTLIAYRKDHIPNPEKSWKLLWDPEYRGRVMMLDDSFEPLAMTLIMQGKKPDTVDEADYKQAAEILLEHLDSMNPSYGTAYETRDAVLSGEMWASMCYSGDAAFAAEENENVDFFVPEEGATIWVDCLGIARDAPQLELAHKFVNFLMAPEIAALNANFIRFATPNRKAIEKIDPDLRNDTRVFPPEEVLARCTFVPQLDAEREGLVNRYWYAVRGAYASQHEKEDIDIDQGEIKSAESEGDGHE